MTRVIQYDEGPARRILTLSETPEHSMHQVERLGASAIDVLDHETEAWAADLRALARSGNSFFSLNPYIFLATKP